MSGSSRLVEEERGIVIYFYCAHDFFYSHIPPVVKFTY